MRQGGDLYTFLYKECGLSAAQVKPAILYEVDASNAMDAEHTLKDIDCFMRDAKQRAYIPGSSVKGAIRTALLFDAIQKERTRHDLIDDKRGIPEADYFHTLNLNPKKRDDAVNSIMRGIQISDSLPIDDRNMMLTLKTDSAVNGQTHAINLCRECVAPGTRIRFALTLDQSILKGKWMADSILEAIAAFADYQNQTYATRFTQPRESVQPAGRNLLMLGGGVGFFSKSLAYPYLGEEKGLQWTSRRLSLAFRNHHHERDVELGISPRTLKYGRYRQRLHAYGACEVTIQ